MEQFKNFEKKENLVIKKCAKCGIEFKGEPGSEVIFCPNCQKGEESEILRICNNCGAQYKGEKCPFCQYPPFRPENVPL